MATWNQIPIQGASDRVGCGLRVLVVGLGRFGGGVGVTRWLAGRGVSVTVTDQADAESLATSLEAISDLDVCLRLGGHDECDLDATDLAIINPAVVKNRSALFERICEAGIPWTTELNLFCQRCPAPVIGVTGSYGKSTTCAMIAGVLEASLSGVAAPCTAVHLGGNIGRSLLGHLGIIRPSDLVVLEMSNAQLEDLPRIAWLPRRAVITNLHPHHLDRYDAAASYFEAKLNVLGRADPESPGPGSDHPPVSMPEQHVIVGDLCTEADGLLRRRLGDRLAGVDWVPADAPEAEPMIELSIPGKHNVANARCALAVCRAVGVSDEVTMRALRSFAGLPHRLQFVSEVGGVKFFNDSKSTSPAATCVSVEAMDAPVVLIVGGQDKAYAALGTWANTVASRCCMVICMGESAARFSDALGQVVRADAAVMRVEVCPDLSRAVQCAKALARPGDVVLFSPGAPSFDAYANFVERGEHFVSLVGQLV